MKSSGPVFTRQNPFPKASTVRKSHYQPSCKQSLSKKEKKTSRSPVRSIQRSTPQLHTLSPESQQQNKKHDHHSSAIDGQPFFSESWPSTDCGSPPGSDRASYDMEAPKQCARPGKSIVSVPGIQQDSVLAKYVERFRHGQPQSREERQQVASAITEEQVAFWWLSDSSLPSSSTPTKAIDKDPATFRQAGQCQRNRSLSPCRGSLSILSDTTQGEFDDTEILHIQERASRLLLKGECTLSDGSIPVSSEGLGSSDFSSPVSVDEPVQRPLISSLIKPFTAKASSSSVHAVSSQKSLIQSLAPPTRPEEDILFQWRLRRKMEQAREWPQSLQPPSLHSSTFSWQAPRLNRPSASGHADEQSTRPPQLSQRDTHPHIPAHQPESREVPRLCPSASDPPLFPAFVSNSSVSQPQNIAHVPAHMHYLCDVLPCPIQSSHARAQQSISQRLDDSQTKVVHKKTQVPKTSTYTFSDGPLRECVHSSEAVEEERSSHPKILEVDKRKKVTVKESVKNTVTSIRQQKKTERSCSHQRLPKKGTTRKEQHRQEGSRTDYHEPPPSPIHTALGQVVSEVLFPTVDSPPAQTPLSPPCTFSAPAQSPVPPCNAQNSMVVISQLLQEAEDSDEKEFEDDPLLQVLRKQRKWIKEQISEVDSVLTEFQEEQQVT